MMQNNQNGCDKPYESMPRIEELLPEYIGSAVYSRYLASDLLRRLEESSEQTGKLFADCIDKAVRNNELPIVMQHVTNVIAERHESMSAYLRVIAGTDAILKRHNSIYSIEPHPTMPNVITVVVNNPYTTQPPYAMNLPATAGIDEDIKVNLLETAIKQWQRLECAILCPPTPSTN